MAKCAANFVAPRGQPRGTARSRTIRLRPRREFLPPGEEKKKLSRRRAEPLKPLECCSFCYF